MSDSRLMSSELENPDGLGHGFPNYSGIKDKKFIKINVLFSTDDPLLQTYFIFSDGVSQSLRQPMDGFFNIGRRQVTEDGARPNDLVLPACDRNISRTHCKINYQPFFDNTIPDTWVAFLMAKHPRLGSRSLVKCLSKNLFRYILSFVKETKPPLLIDLGGPAGTFIRVSNSDFFHLTQGMNFVLAQDVVIEITSIKNETEIMSINSDATIEDTWNSGTQINERPFIGIKVSRILAINKKDSNESSWMFLAEDNYKIFTIGRSKLSDIKIENNTCSRTHCRVIYTGGNWVLLDGDVNKPTVNGTWLAISKSNTTTTRKISDPYPLHNGSQIKISNSILQVTWKAA